MKKIFNIQKALPVDRKNVTLILSIFAIIYVLILYLIGIKQGFYSATVTLSAHTVLTVILPIICFIILTEYIREKILFGKLKHKKIIAFLIVFLAEILVSIWQYDITKLKDFLAFMGNVIFVGIANNLLFNYICIRYGKLPNILYRLIISLYVYIIPITPNIHILVEIIMKMIIPYIIYQVLEYIYSKKQEFISRTEKRKTWIINIVAIIILAIIPILISGSFKYGILVIGSGSMTGSINKGDTIIYEQFKEQKIKTGQVVIFKSDKKIIVHRVVEIKNINNEKRYYTKGDFNKENDEGYITNENIIGIYKFKIDKVGYLTLWINDVFEK